LHADRQVTEKKRPQVEKILLPPAARLKNEERLSRSEQRTGKKQKRPLDRKSPIQVRILLPPVASHERTGERRALLDHREHRLFRALASFEGTNGVPSSAAASTSLRDHLTVPVHQFWRVGVVAGCCSARCLLSIAFRLVRIAETQRQHRSFKPDLPVKHPQSQDPCTLTASGTRHAKVKLAQCRLARLITSERAPTNMRLKAQVASKLNQLRDTNLRPRWR
jgi:hypothetical protein